MIKGMTGYGSAQFSAGKNKGMVEIKSLNHRYFDINYYLPIGFGSAENKIRQMINKHIVRGRVTVSVKITHKAPTAPVMNGDVINQYLKQSRSLKRKFSLKNDLTLADVIKLPGVIETIEATNNVAELWPAIEKSLNTALRSLVTMRKSEGRSLSTDVQTQLKRMSTHVKKVRMRAKIILREKKKALTTEEYAAYQKNDDINEEISRLSHYIDELKTLLKSQTAVGKKMDFVAQEMQRETNTIGSKLQDKVVANAVIALKSKVEKIREQSQNIE